MAFDLPAPVSSLRHVGTGRPTPWTLTLAALRELQGSKRYQARFLLRSLLRRSVLQRWSRSDSPSLSAYLAERPELCGALLWPYQCSTWTAAERIPRIESHFSILDTAPHEFRFGVSEHLHLADFTDRAAGAHLILDQPKWLFREGLLALNIFLHGERAYSLSFSLQRQGGETQMFIGGLQGRRSADALAQYRKLTDDFHGLRPRDLLIEMLKACAPLLGVTRILAVADEHRCFRHSYFGRVDHPDLVTNYNEIWSERGGTRVATTHWELPLAPSIRRLDDVPCKKRALYRRRNEMLASLFERVQEGTGRKRPGSDIA